MLTGENFVYLCLLLLSFLDPDRDIEHHLICLDDSKNCSLKKSKYQKMVRSIFHGFFCEFVQKTDNILIFNL